MLNCARTIRNAFKSTYLPNAYNFDRENSNITRLEIPKYPVNKPQSLEQRKARLIYQSRKRGMLENGLLLSTFAHKHLKHFNEEQTLMYDNLVNNVDNDWDIYYWVTGRVPVPVEYDNEIMHLLKQHINNEEKKILMQPDL